MVWIGLLDDWKTVFGSVIEVFCSDSPQEIIYSKIQKFTVLKLVIWESTEHSNRIKGYFSWISRDLFNNWPFIFVFVKGRKLPRLLKTKLLFKLLVKPCINQYKAAGFISSSLRPYLRILGTHTTWAARSHTLLCSQHLHESTRTKQRKSLECSQV